MEVVNATVENYDVWFLAHSNCNGSQTTRWKNDVLNIDCDIIEEYFLGTDYEFQSFPPSKYDRLVFVKMYDNQYAFMGIYRQVDIDYMTKCRTYKRIKKEYVR